MNMNSKMHYHISDEKWMNLNHWTNRDDNIWQIWYTYDTNHKITDLSYRNTAHSIYNLFQVIKKSLTGSGMNSFLALRYYCFIVSTTYSSPVAIHRQSSLCCSCTKKKYDKFLKAFINYMIIITITSFIHINLPKATVKVMGIYLCATQDTSCSVYNIK